MEAPEMLDKIELAIIAGIARFGPGWNEAERRAFRLGFLVGARHVLDLAHAEIKKTFINER
jgi:hypothetical protein